MISQIQEKQLCSPNKPFVVVLEKGFKKNEISPFEMDFEICNFVDLFMPKHTHYTLTKIQKVKKHNSTPLMSKLEMTSKIKNSREVCVSTTQ